MQRTDHVSARVKPPAVRPLAIIGSYRPVLVLVALAWLLLTLGQLLLRDRVHAQPYEVPIGSWPDQLFVHGFYEREGRNSDRYRWTTAGSLLSFHQIGSSTGTQLTLRLGQMPDSAPDPALTLRINGNPLTPFTVAHTPRTYHVLVPGWSMRNGDLEVGFESPLFSTPRDPRQLGVRLDHVSVQIAAGTLLLPALAQLFDQLVLLLICGLTLAHLGWGVRACAAALALVSLGLLFVYSYHLLMLDIYMGRLVIGLVVAALLAWLAPPLLTRYLPWVGPHALARQLAVLLFVACAFRLAGGLFPEFAAHDLPRNIGRLLMVHGGDLVIVARSAEFGSGFTVYPPAPYVVMLPLGLLISNPGVIVQGSLALIDGTSALLIALLALRLGCGRRAALLTGLLYVALPISLTGLWWGFTAQTFGQWLMAPLALLLLAGCAESRRWPWIGAGTLFTIALLSHIGVTILAVAWLGLALLSLAWPRALPRRAWLAFATMFIVGCSLGFALIYADVAATKLDQAAKVGESALATPFDATYGLIWKGLSISFSPVGLALIPVGLMLLWQRMRGPATAIMGAWLVATIIFLAVELVLGLQVRYIYFFMPPGCIALGLLLDRLWARGRAGLLAASGLIILLTVQGALLWYAGTFESIKLSITPLSH